jgi:hypothetical protein
MSSYTDIFGGSTVQPADVSYRAIALSASVTLVWPIAYDDTTDVVARINDVTPTTTGFTITMPDATQVSPGQDALFANLGADTFTILASDGSTISAVTTGVVLYIYLTDNSTAVGTWQVTTFASTTTTANAATLAGYGLTAITTTLNQDAPVLTKTTGFTVDATYRAQLALWTGGTDTAALPAAATAGDGFFFLVANRGSGILTIDPSGAELIDGATTKDINATESAIIITDGSAWYSVGYGRSFSSGFTRLVKSVAGASDVTLTTVEATYIVQEYTGALTANINVIVPTAVGQFWVYNNTSGAYTLTVKTTAGTGIAVTQGNREILYCDGTNVVVADDSVRTVTAGVALTDSGTATAPIIDLDDTAVTPATYGGTGAVASVVVDQQGRITGASDVALSLTTGISGILPVANGGTNSATAGAARTALAAAGLADQNLFTAIQKWSKGSDIASATTLTLGTDGNYFDVTGNTGPIGTIACAAGALFMLQFDSTPTITHGAALVLPRDTDIVATAGDFLIGYAVALNSVVVLQYLRADSPLAYFTTGTVIKRTIATTATFASGTTTLPADDTIPQSTEGDEYLTIAVTPVLSTSAIRLTVNGYCSGDPNIILSAALFQDTTAGAFFATSIGNGNNSSRYAGFSFTTEVAAASTTARTYKLRMGTSNGTTLGVLGTASARTYGGVGQLSIIAEEIAA